MLCISGASNLKDIPNAFRCGPVSLCTPPGLRKDTRRVPAPHLGTLGRRWWAGFLRSHEQFKVPGSGHSSSTTQSLFYLAVPSRQGPKGLTENSEPPEDMKSNRCMSWAMFQPHFLKDHLNALEKCIWSMYAKGKVQMKDLRIFEIL